MLPEARAGDRLIEMTLELAIRDVIVLSAFPPSNG
jgi:hypothetical protein